MVDANLALIVCESNLVDTRQRDIQDFRISGFGFSDRNRFRARLSG